MTLVISAPEMSPVQIASLRNRAFEPLQRWSGGQAMTVRDLESTDIWPGHARLCNPAMLRANTIAPAFEWVVLHRRMMTLYGIALLARDPALASIRIIVGTNVVAWLPLQVLSAYPAEWDGEGDHPEPRHRVGYFDEPILLPSDYRCTIELHAWRDVPAEAEPFALRGLVAEPLGVTVAPVPYLLP